MAGQKFGRAFPFTPAVGAAQGLPRPSEAVPAEEDEAMLQLNGR
jgi:hypothetical protein